jgi:hypothetical protein
MPVFASTAELETYAEKFVGERLDALEKDTQHCLILPYAPFPAILLSFSTIDLLGALAAGNASKNAPTTAQSADYMRQFMNYTADQATLLQGLFRHKLVHLAQPRAVISFNGKSVSWHYWHDDASHHLNLVTLPAARTVAVASGLSLAIEQEFEFSRPPRERHQRVGAQARWLLGQVENERYVASEFREGDSRNLRAVILRGRLSRDFSLPALTLASFGVSGPCSFVSASSPARPLPRP